MLSIILDQNSAKLLVQKHSNINVITCNRTHMTKNRLYGIINFPCYNIVFITRAVNMLIFPSQEFLPPSKSPVSYIMQVMDSVFQSSSLQYWDQWEFAQGFPRDSNSILCNAQILLKENLFFSDFPNNILVGVFNWQWGISNKLIATLGSCSDKNHCHRHCELCCSL